MPEPIKIGWLGAALDGPGGGYDKIHRMAFDEAVESGLLDRPYEFVLHAENGLPTARRRTRPTASAIWSTRGASGSPARTAPTTRSRSRPLANELGVPLISWAGTERLQGEYCFRLGNGDVGGDAALVVVRG